MGPSQAGVSEARTRVASAGAVCAGPRAGGPQLGGVTPWGQSGPGARGRRRESGKPTPGAPLPPAPVLTQISWRLSRQGAGIRGCPSAQMPSAWPLTQTGHKAYQALRSHRLSHPPPNPGSGCRPPPGAGPRPDLRRIAPGGAEDQGALSGDGQPGCGWGVAGSGFCLAPSQAPTPGLGATGPFCCRYRQRPLRSPAVRGTRAGTRLLPGQGVDTAGLGPRRGRGREMGSLPPRHQLRSGM